MDRRAPNAATTATKSFDGGLIRLAGNVAAFRSDSPDGVDLVVRLHGAPSTLSFAERLWLLVYSFIPRIGMGLKRIGWGGYAMGAPTDSGCNAPLPAPRKIALSPSY